jgi:cellulose synthase/poly-beta-1,6-N-acetylglucosamine synthase-like glycosyltransferase
LFDTALTIIVFASLGLVVYSYAIYPFILGGIAGAVQLIRDTRYVFSKAERRAQEDEGPPSVAIVIAAFNEERHIAARIENLISLDYPSNLVNIFVGSDGSTDQTNQILASYSDHRIQTFAFEQNRGKASVLNDLVGRTAAPILVFSDANTNFDRQALRRLVGHFKDQSVGVVSGELRLRRSSGDNRDSLYWRIEQYLKFFESRIGGLLGANGAIYAIRRNLWRPLAADTICDDFCVAMNIAAGGNKLVYEPSAYAEEDTPDAIGEEFKRRVRIGVGNFQALFRHPEYLTTTSVGTAFAYLSHKVLRWVAPHLLLFAFMASALLALSHESWRIFASFQLAGYFGAWLLYWRSNRGYPSPKIFAVPTFLFALNWAFLIASVRYVSGGYGGAWRRTER